MQQNQNIENMLKDMAFCLSEENLEKSMLKIFWILQQKTGISPAKTASKKVVQKTAEATGDLTGNRIADKITSAGKTKSKYDEINKRQEIYIPPKKRQQIINDKNGIPKKHKPTRYNI